VAIHLDAPLHGVDRSLYAEVSVGSMPLHHPTTCLGEQAFGYDFHVEYLLGKANTIAVTLSQQDEDCAMALALSSPAFTLFGNLCCEMTELEDDKHLLEMIGKDEAADKWSMVNGLTVYSDLIFVLTTSSLWLALLAMTHGAGHEGIQKTLHRLLASFYNVNTAKLVKDYIKCCVVCQRNKSEHLHPVGLLQPLELLVWCGPT
jgi:hypothetical protein